MGLLLSLGTTVGELLLFAPILLVREAKISVVKNSECNGEVFEEALLVRRRRRSRGGRGISRIQVHLKVIKSLNYLILSISLPVWQYVELIQKQLMRASQSVRRALSNLEKLDSPYLSLKLLVSCLELWLHKGVEKRNTKGD